MAVLLQGVSDGSFNSEDGILFYAHGTDFWDRTEPQPEFIYHSYSDRNVYYLALSGTFPGAAKRITTTAGDVVQVGDTLTKFIDYVRREENIELSRSASGDVFDYYHWYWGLAGDNQLFFSLPAPAPFSVNSLTVRSTRSNFDIRVNGVEADFDSTGILGIY